MCLYCIFQKGFLKFSLTKYLIYVLSYPFLRYSGVVRLKKKDKMSCYVWKLNKLCSFILYFLVTNE